MERTVLTGAMLLDGTGGPPGPGRAVVVEHGRIRAVVVGSERIANCLEGGITTIEHETGRIVPGLAADLLAVAGNPVERIQALDDGRLVMTQGRVTLDRLP